MEKLTFMTDDDEKMEFYIIEETRINGTNYLLVTDSDSDEDEAAAYIMKDTSDEGSSEAVYEFVDDETEFESVGKIFDELLEDMDVRGAE